MGLIRSGKYSGFNNYADNFLCKILIRKLSRHLLYQFINFNFNFNVNEPETNFVIAVFIILGE